MSSKCRSHIYSDFLESRIFEFKFGFANSTISATRSEGNLKTQLGIKIDNEKHFSQMMLHSSTESLVEEFYLKWVVYRSEVPSSEPSQFPTTSIFPSVQPSACVDEPGWKVGGSSPLYSGFTCEDITDAFNSLKWCLAISKLEDGVYSRKSVQEAW